MVNNNDILRRIRYIFDYNDDRMMELFKLGDFDVNRSQISDWLKRDDDPGMKQITDVYLSSFLNGIIVSRRGKKEGQTLIPESLLTNNIVLRKLKIALNLIDEEMIEVFKLAGFDLSKHELSAFFRNVNHRQYRPCKDQYVRNFLKGMKIKYRDLNFECNE